MYLTWSLLISVHCRDVACHFFNSDIRVCDPIEIQPNWYFKRKIVIPVVQTCPFFYKNSFLREYIQFRGMYGFAYKVPVLLTCTPIFLQGHASLNKIRLVLNNIQIKTLTIIFYQQIFSIDQVREMQNVSIVFKSNFNNSHRVEHKK